MSAPAPHDPDFGHIRQKRACTSGQVGPSCAAESCQASWCRNQSSAAGFQLSALYEEYASFPRMDSLLCPVILFTYRHARCSAVCANHKSVVFENKKIA